MDPRHASLVVLAWMTATPVAAQVSLGVGAGIVHPNDVHDGDSPYFTGQIGIPLFHRFHLAPNIGYWTTTARWESGACHPQADGCSETQTTRRLDMGVHLLFQVPVQERVRLFVGAGAGISKTRWERSGSWSATIDDSKRSSRVLVGLEVDIGRPLAVFGALRYDLLHGAAQTEIKALAGLRYRFGGARTSSTPPP